jgi:hypothetical protein
MPNHGDPITPGEYLAELERRGCHKPTHRLCVVTGGPVRLELKLNGTWRDCGDAEGAQLYEKMFNYRLVASCGVVPIYKFKECLPAKEHDMREWELESEVRIETSSRGNPVHVVVTSLGTNI